MLAKIKRFSLPQGLMQSLLTVFGNMGATGISAVAMILISRTLGPTKFGEFSVGFAILIMLNKLNDLGLSLALLRFIPQTSDTDTQNKLFSYSLKVKLTTAIAIAIICVATTPYFAKLINFPNTEILYLTFILNICTVLYEHLLAMLQSLHKFLQSVLAAAIQAGTKLFTALILMLYLPESTLFAFTTYAAAPLIPIFLVGQLLPSNIKFSITDTAVKHKDKLWKMAGHSAVGFVALGIIDNIDVLFVQRYLDSYETGLLAGSARIAMLFSLAAYSLSTVLNSRVARYSKTTDIFSYIKKAVLLSVVIVIGYIALIPFSKFAILFTIGQEYLASHTILNILLAASFITIITTPFAALFFSLKRLEWYFSVSGILQLVLIIAGNAIFVPQFGIAGAAWTRVGVKLVLFLFTIAVAIWAVYSQHLRKSHEHN